MSVQSADPVHKEFIKLPPEIREKCLQILKFPENHRELYDGKTPISMTGGKFVSDSGVGCIGPFLSRAQSNPDFTDRDPTVSYPIRGYNM